MSFPLSGIVISICIVQQKKLYTRWYQTMKAKTTAHQNIYRDTVYDNSPTRLRELSSTKYIPSYYIYALSLTFSSDQKAQKKKVHVYILCLCTHSYRQCWYKYYSCTVNVVIYNVCTKYLQFYLKCKYVQDSAITTLSK